MASNIQWTASMFVAVPACSWDSQVPVALVNGRNQKNEVRIKKEQDTLIKPFKVSFRINLTILISK